uniref:Uncharacterized protein n=1 Tax=Rhizophora mucronata TaxID=61149 RepID=A0A2P2Q5W3_RHIMU
MTKRAFVCTRLPD